MKKNFDEFRFKGLNYRQTSNKYLTMNRVSDDEDKIVVRFDDSHIIPTRYGYAIVVGYNKVVFVKDWQVNRNFYHKEVLFDKNYFNVKEWGNFADDFYFEDEEKQLHFEYWLEVAKEQDSLINEDGEKLNPVKWKK